jgi:hypothetical protein
MTIPAGAQYPNALDPQYQDETDDFAGRIAHGVNLTLEGVVAVGAMEQMAACAGKRQGRL